MAADPSPQFPLTDRGALSAFLCRWFGPNWKTSSSSVAAAGFGFIAFSPELFGHWPWLIALSKYCAIGGLVSLGVNARDKQ